MQWFSFIFHCRASLHLHELVHCRWVEEVTQVCFNMDIKNLSYQGNASYCMFAYSEFFNLLNDNLNSFSNKIAFTCYVRSQLTNIDTSILLENPYTPLIKFIQSNKYIWDLSGIFSILSLERILMSLMSFSCFFGHGCLCKQ